MKKKMKKKRVKGKGERIWFCVGRERLTLFLFLFLIFFFQKKFAVDIFIVGNSNG